MFFFLRNYYPSVLFVPLQFALWCWRHNKKETSEPGFLKNRKWFLFFFFFFPQCMSFDTNCLLLNEVMISIAVRHVHCCKYNFEIKEWLMIASAFPGAAKDFLYKNPHTCLSSCLLHCKNVIKQNKVRGGYFFPTQSAAKLPNLKLVNPRRLAFLVVIKEGDREGRMCRRWAWMRVIWNIKRLFEGQVHSSGVYRTLWFFTFTWYIVADKLTCFTEY